MHGSIAYSKTHVKLQKKKLLFPWSQFWTTHNAEDCVRASCAACEIFTWVFFGTFLSELMSQKSKLSASVYARAFVCAIRHV